MKEILLRIKFSLRWPIGEFTEDITQAKGPSQSSDESEPSWLEPKLELKDFQLGSGPFSPQLEIKNRPKTSRNVDFDFFFQLYS